MKSEFKETVEDFRISTCAPISTGIDGANEILPMIYSIATLMAFGHRKYEGDEVALEHANPELLAGAFDALGYLAAQALLHLDNR